MIVSHQHFMYFVTAMVVGVGVAWTIVDSIRLRRALREDTADPIVRDRIFGSLVGIAVCVWGILGALAYWGYIELGS